MNDDHLIYIIVSYNAIDPSFGRVLWRLRFISQQLYQQGNPYVLHPSSNNHHINNDAFH